MYQRFRNSEILGELYVIINLWERERDAYKPTKMKRDDKWKKNDRNKRVVLLGGTTIDIIDITVHIEIIDRESHNKFLKRTEMRSRCNFASSMHRCSIFTILLFSSFAGIRNWAGIPRYELIPTCRRRSEDHIGAIQEIRETISTSISQEGRSI